MTKVGKVLISIGVGVGILSIGGFTLWKGVDDGGVSEQMERGFKLGLPKEPNDAVPKVDASRNAGPILFEVGKQISEYRDAEGKPAFRQSGGSDADLIALQPLVKRLMEASKLTACSFNKDFSKGTAVAFPEYAATKDSVKLLQYDAVRLARAGDAKGAFGRLQAGARITNLLGKSEPTLISSLVQIANSAIVGRGIMLVLTELGPTEIALNEADKTIDALGDHADIKRAMTGEWVLGALYLPKISASELSSWTSMGSSSEDEANRKAFEAAFSIPSVRNKMTANYLKYFVDYYESLPENPQSFLEAHKVSTDLDVKLENDKDFNSTLSKIMFPVFSQSHMAVGKEIAQRRTIRNLIAALRTNSKKLPSLGEESMDPFTGTKLNFERNGNAITIYSVGTDLTDDGGDASISKDVVARYPWTNANTSKKP